MFISLSWKMLKLYIFVALSLVFLAIRFPADIRSIPQPYSDLTFKDLKRTNDCTY